MLTGWSGRLLQLKDSPTKRNSAVRPGVGRFTKSQDTAEVLVAVVERDSCSCVQGPRVSGTLRVELRKRELPAIHGVGLACAPGLLC